MCGALDGDDVEPDVDRVVVDGVERELPERTGAIVDGAVVAPSLTVGSVVVTPVPLDAATGVPSLGLDRANPATSAAIAANADAPMTRRARAATWRRRGAGPERGGGPGAAGGAGRGASMDPSCASHL